MQMSIDMLLFWLTFWSYLAATIGAALYAGTRNDAIRGGVFVATLLGFGLNTAALIARSAMSGHPPVTNLFEYLSFFAWAIVLGFLLVWRRKGAELLTVFAAAVAFAMMVMASLFPSEASRQLIPALQSYWLWIHVSLAVLAEAAFAVAFVASIMCLIGDKRGHRRLPDRALLDAITYRWIAIGFPLFTVGALFAGAVWAQRAWGTPWSWDPKETSSLVVWLIYAIYLHVRRTRRGSIAITSGISVLGFAMTILTILGSKFLGGLHSYG
ncbi:MAG: c-type cytochrome biogenesis protein CcsB [Candidatus Eisenbacteria bacterium]|nr:c-type cytochrome biogenesis protein CcsB [Candidatus Eisenbacteria bacterium]